MSDTRYSGFLVFPWCPIRHLDLADFLEFWRALLTAVLVGMYWL